MQAVSDTTLLCQSKYILPYGQQDVCEFYYCLLVRQSKGEKQAVSDNVLVLYLIHIAYHGQQAVSDHALVGQYYLIHDPNRK